MTRTYDAINGISDRTVINDDLYFIQWYNGNHHIIRYTDWLYDSLTEREEIFTGHYNKCRAELKKIREENPEREPW